MRKSFVLSILLCILVVSCKKNSVAPKEKEAEVANPQQKITCGTDQSLSGLSKTTRDAFARDAVVNNMATSILIYLDFDGIIVQPGFPSPIVGSTVRSTLVNNTRFCPNPGLTENDKAEIIRLVEDDFSPFNIQLTTDVNVFNAYTPTQNKEICIITTVPSVLGMSAGTGGVAPFAGPGIRLPFHPYFVFSQLYSNPGEIAAVISHETGHIFGLIHQNFFNENCQFLAEYHPGFGSGPLSFGPIMGDGVDKKVTNWFAQPCVSPSFGVAQDDYQSLNTQVEQKTDDFPDQPTSNTTHTSGPINGILEKQNDVDYILINFKNPGPITITSNNIDIKASVYNNGGHLMGEYNDPNSINVTIPSANGKRYLKIEAAGNVNMSPGFMTGRYTVNF